MKNIQSRETGNLRYTTRRKTKHKHNTICVGHHYKQLTLIRHEPPYKQLVICGIRVIQNLLFCVIFCSKIKKKIKKIPHCWSLFAFVTIMSFHLLFLSTRLVFSNFSDENYLTNTSVKCIFTDIIYQIYIWNLQFIEMLFDKTKVNCPQV
jgi:hypothetical protein